MIGKKSNFWKGDLTQGQVSKTLILKSSLYNVIIQVTGILVFKEGLFSRFYGMYASFI